MSLFSSLFGAILPKTDHHDPYHEAIREEAKVGGQVFGPIPAGVRREFFCLDEYTWVWHEEWTDEKGQSQIRTTRYDIRPSGIHKAQDSQPYQPVSRQEAKHLLMAMRRYNELIDAELAPFMAVR